VTVRETVDARKTKFGAGELAGLLGDAKEIVVAKGKKSLLFKVGKDLDWDEVEGVALGRSGNLRAPTVRVGKRVLVGYSDDVWESFFG
jgi:hypothetical protein